jgi:alkane 1-monooxygenase
MNFIRKIGFFSAFIIPSLVIFGIYLGGWWQSMALIFVFILIPIIDAWAGLDTHNIPVADKPVVGEAFYYRLVTYLWVFVQLGFLGWALAVVSRGQVQSTAELIVFIISCGLVTGGIGITVAHELGHKKSRLEQLFSQALLLSVCYMHFFIEHNRGHHVYVATPEDPATARKHQHVYAFWIQSVFAGYAHAWKLERQTLKNNNRSVLSIHNRMIWYAALPLLGCTAVTIWLSHGEINWLIPVFFFGQSVVAFTLLELVNYVEHYGIQRFELSPGQYERVNPLHSWNASHLISNFFLFQLQRHSDHHYNAIKRYQILDHHDTSPQLPFGYPTMILVALIPPVWFAIMDPRLTAFEQQRAAH